MYYAPTALNLVTQQCAYERSALPPPRVFTRPVEVQLTDLETAHLPAREHREEEIRLYKRRNKISPADPDLSAEERHPQFLKSKGDALYQQGNYRYSGTRLRLCERKPLLQERH